MYRGSFRDIREREPKKINTDQGVQYTSIEFTSILKNLRIQINMDDQRIALNTVFVKRLLRSLKYENVYLHNYETMKEAHEGINEHFYFYNTKKKLQILGV